MIWLVLFMSVKLPRWSVYNNEMHNVSLFSPSLAEIILAAYLTFKTIWSSKWWSTHQYLIAILKAVKF